jgi:alpha-glucoside transport system permease protein
MDIYRLSFLIAAVVGVPLVLFAYIVLSDFAIRRLPGATPGRIRPWLWVGPALLLVAIFLVYPGIATIWISLIDPHTQQFSGLSNYAQVLGDNQTLIAIRNNILWLVLYTGLVLLFGVILAVLADRVPYEGVVKGLIFMPMAISFVAAGVIWKFMFNYQPPGLPQTGTLNAFLSLFHINPIAWLIDQRFNNFALILVGVWVWTGFALVIISAALKAIPAELLEAARVDGANEFQVFGRVIVPLLAPTLTVIATTLIIFALKAFDVVYVMTNGNYNTTILALRMYQELFTVRNPGRSSAVAIILLIAVIPVLAFNLRRFQAQEATR